MDIRLHDTLTKDRKRVVPGPDGRVGMYVCGPTVYDRAHIGNARPAVVFDTLYRLLRHAAVNGDSDVKSAFYVRNFTDVDDKILARAEESGRPISEITEETTRWYLEDMGALGCLEPDAMPRATDYVNNPAHPVDMVRLIARLIETGHAYEAEGHVLFSVSSWGAYGTLSRRSTDELLAGARVDVAPYKREPMDFVLWKPSEPHEPGWESPWGRGRPGWHIECSAMAEAILGRESGHRVQIHGGGIDLVFPHHENERAQSCCAFGVDDMADIWMHNGYLMVEGEKMSKSLGNFITVKDLRDRGVPGEVIRFVLLKTHYRQPLDWTEEAVTEATQTLAHWAKRLARYEPAELAGVGAEDVPGAVAEALADDLNTPNALAEISYLARKASPSDPAVGRALVASAGLLGFDLPGLPAYEAELSKARQHRAGIADSVERAFETADDRQIARLLERRTEARKARDFATADRIRDGLAAAGVDIRDGPDGTTFARTGVFDPDKLAQLEADA